MDLCGFQRKAHHRVQNFHNDVRVRAGRATSAQRRAAL
jgi:hypothetical protein